MKLTWAVLAVALGAAGVEVDHRRLATGHTLTRGDVEAAAGWLRSCNP